MFSFLAFAGTLLLGIVAMATVFDSQRKAEIEAESRARRLDSVPETSKIRGFQHVVHAAHGEFATFEGYMDEKTVCRGLEPELPGICTAVIYYGEEARIIVRIRKCSPSVTTDCLLCTDADGAPLKRDRLRAIDSMGDPIDFLGERLVEPPGSWGISNPRPLRLTGRVSRVYGSGRIVEPIHKIEAVN